jgi:hypothetical protein
VWDFAEGVGSDVESDGVDTDVDIDLTVIGRAIPLSPPEPPKRLSAAASSWPPLSAGASEFAPEDDSSDDGATLAEIGRWMLAVALSS